MKRTLTIEPRRSPRIFELDAQRAQQMKRQHMITSYVGAKEESGKTKEPIFWCKQGRKRTKVRHVQDFDVNLFINQATKVGNPYASTCHRNADVISVYKDKLEMMLRVLKRKDKHKIFAEPVNGDEVEHYYEAIKEPMDFRTMSEKLKQNKYKRVEEFERDVTLVYENAMYFNDDTTIYFKEARKIQFLAEKLFKAFKSDPQNFKATLSRGRLKITNSGRAKVGVSINATQQRNQVHDETTESERRRTYDRPLLFSIEQLSLMTFASYDAPKTLQFNEHADTGYVRSLRRFSKDLGPTAQLAASRMMSKCISATNFVHKNIFVAPSVEVPPKFLGSMSAISNFLLANNWVINQPLTCAESMCDLGLKVSQLLGNHISGHQVFSSDGTADMRYESYDQFPYVNLGEEGTGTSALTIPYEKTGLLQDAILQPRNSSWHWPASGNQTIADARGYYLSTDGVQVAGTSNSSCGVRGSYKPMNTIDFFHEQQQAQPFVQPETQVKYLF